MIANLVKFIICSNFGSPEHLEDYPVKGQKLCTNCGHESIELQLKIAETANEISDNCPFCGKEGEEDDTLYENESITIFKCKKCGKLDGYYLPCMPTDNPYDFPFSFEGEYDSLSVKETEEEKNYIYPASKYKAFAKALQKKERDPREKCKRQLDLQLYKIRQKMQQNGIEYETINRAKWKLYCFIEREGPFTEKQLQSQFSAAISLAQDELIRVGRFYGKKITQRQIKEIFNVDRKTIRKWKTVLKEKRVPLKLRVYARQEEGQPANGYAEIPSEIKLILKLEKPYRGKCDFCEQIKLLSWRIQYTNGSWSDICEHNYERLIEYSKDYEWQIEKFLVSSNK
jgi:hypothetical protein